jgi:transposase
MRARERLTAIEFMDPMCLRKVFVSILTSCSWIHTRKLILGHLLRHLPGKLLVVWDGLPQHRARLVTEFIRAQRGRLAIERLPAYAPELNPVEYILGYWKHHELLNFCPRDFGQLSYRRAAWKGPATARFRGTAEWTVGGEESWLISRASPVRLSTT